MFAFLLAHWGWFVGCGGIVGALVALGFAIGPVALLQHWKAVTALLLGAAAALAIAFLYVALDLAGARLATANANYAVVTGQNQTLNATNANLVKQTLLQSKAVQLVADDAREAKKASAQALADATAKQAADQTSIAALQARVSNPKTNAGGCDDEIARIRSSL
jgi:signal transduction histidine kinase